MVPPAWIAERSRTRALHDAFAVARRGFLASAGGLGGLALACLLREPAHADSHGSYASGLHFPGRVRRVIQLFMNGGVSQMDTFDYKPLLAQRHGQQIDFGIKMAATSAPGAVMKSPFRFRQHGQCGRWVSEVFPEMARHVDQMAFLMAMASKTNVHGPASYLQNTGFLAPGFPCLGAWVLYGLGRLTDNLPAFVVLPDHRGLPYNNAGNFSTAFLPATNAPVVLNPNAAKPIPNLQPAAIQEAAINDQSEAAGRALLRELNLRHEMEHPGDSRLQARIESFELAARMQLSAPEVLDLTRESAATLALYGLEDPTTAPFARNCLVARRLIERDVRFVQVWSGMAGASNNWDNHSDIPRELPFIARTVDRPIAGLLTDLRQRGLLDDTLVVWTSEFGRMPFTQGTMGRDHNGGTFVSWLAGGGVRGGVSIGQSDEYSYRAAESVTTGYDLNATILHLLGIDHERLTFGHNGVQRRLTDVHGQVIREILS
jgi:hypothetical protein